MSSEIILEGLIKKAYYGTTKFDEKQKYRITLFNENLDYTQITAYDQTSAKLTPGWYKDQEGYLNTASEYDIPVRAFMEDGRHEDLTFNQWIECYPVYDSHVKLKIRQKDGAVYPVSIVMITAGKEKDPFEGM